MKTFTVFSESVLILCECGAEYGNFRTDLCVRFMNAVQLLLDVTVYSAGEAELHAHFANFLEL